MWQFACKLEGTTAVFGAGVRFASSVAQVQSHDLRPAGPGDVIVHGGEVHLVSSDR